MTLHPSTTIDFATLRKLSGDTAVADAACPLCGPDCRATSNQARKVLRIWDDGDFVTYKCARCEASGWARDDGASSKPSARMRSASPEPTQDRAELARFLWSRSTAIIGTPAETYLRRRCCDVASPNLRFLPAKGHHPPALIARFGVGDVRGVHLTKLKPDGAGKAGTANDKIMIGPSAGQPIVVQDNPERGELLIAEGIEDAASLARATGWTAWAAGAAGRLAQCLAVVPAAADAIYVAVDRDAAGRRAHARARALRADIIVIRVWHALAASDANAALVKFGPDALLAAIEWCAATESHGRGTVGFHAMQTALMRATGIFQLIAGDGL